MVRYSVIGEKNPREIVLLRGKGCVWKKCTFCDYHLDCSPDEEANFALNQSVLSQVSGCTGTLEVINSGSFEELDTRTRQLILDVCGQKKITKLHFESHWLFHRQAAETKKHFEEMGITVKRKIGVETFDTDMRERIFCKGIGNRTPQEIASWFEEACLLQGVEGQTLESMQRDIEIGLSCFERICINIMNENNMPIHPDKKLIEQFYTRLYPVYKDNARVDILMENTEFGVGEKSE
jgi:hypothetical protein